MQDIILYVAIILLGYFITKKGLIPKFIDDKVGMLQSFSLFFLLGMMGYKIGADRELLSKFHILGINSVIITICAIIGSVLLVHIVYRGGKK